MTETNFNAAEAFVRFGLGEKAAGRRESASGPGSTLRAAGDAMGLLRRTLSDLPIRSILDLGCGDWNWMQSVGLPKVSTQSGPRFIRYEGWEASAELVADLNRRYGCEGIRFVHRDICLDPFPTVDLIILRDVLFHLETRLAADIIRRVKKSAPLLLATTFPTVPDNADIKQYLPIEGWGFHKTNLAREPFSLGGYEIDGVDESLCAHRGDPRRFCLYRF